MFNAILSFQKHKTWSTIEMFIALSHVSSFICKNDCIYKQNNYLLMVIFKNPIFLKHISMFIATYKYWISKQSYNLHKISNGLVFSMLAPNVQINPTHGFNIWMKAKSKTLKTIPKVLIIIHKISSLPKFVLIIIK